MRFRIKFHDAPEVWMAFRIYRVSEDGRRQPLLTVNVGADALYAARKIVFQSHKVFLEVKRNPREEMYLDQDLYGRKLVNIWIQKEEGESLQPIAVILAKQGHTYQFLQHGYSREVARAVKLAEEEKIGLRSLPKTCRKFPMRPFEVRQEWKDPDQVPTIYNRDYVMPIEEIETANKSIRDIILKDPSTMGYITRLIRSTLENEGLCFYQKSTIPGAGMGLFLRPRQRVISKGKLLCLHRQVT